MSFFSFNNANVEFAELEKLTWRSYNIAEILPTIDKVEFINKKEFARAVLDKSFKIFMVYIATLEILTTILIYLFRIS